MHRIILILQEKRKKKGEICIEFAMMKLEATKEIIFFILEDNVLCIVVILMVQRYGLGYHLPVKIIQDTT
jgi:hypothetical protein